MQRRIMDIQEDNLLLTASQQQPTDSDDLEDGPEMGEEDEDPIISKIQRRLSQASDKKMPSGGDRRPSTTLKNQIKLY
jgi:hypothetical protein